MKPVEVCLSYTDYNFDIGVAFVNISKHNIKRPTIILKKEQTLSLKDFMELSVEFCNALSINLF